MHNLPGRFFNWSTSILYVLVCSVFFFVFVLVYDPFSLHDGLDMGRGLFSMNLAICFSIVLGLLAAFRLLLHYLRSLKRFTWSHYVVWCMGEVLLLSFFVALYINLMKADGSPYIATLSSWVGYCYLIMIIPYLVLTLSFTIAEYREKARTALAPPEPEDDSSLIHFYDEHQKGRLIVASEAVLFIEAEENYVKIHYLKSGIPTEYVLRASMRSLEGTAEKHGLVRCQRSYYINPSHVKVLRRESGAQMFADLDVPGLPGIPVSRSYGRNLTELL